MKSASALPRSAERTSTDITAIWPGVLLAVYLTGTGALLIAGRAALTIAALHGIMLAAVVVTILRPVPLWVRRWLPLTAPLFLYMEMPRLIGAAGHASLFDAVVMRWERLVFGSQPALEWAFRWPSVVGSEFLHGAYLSYYAIIFAVPLLLFLRRRYRDFDEAAFVLLFTFVVCFACYVAFPVAGPRYLFAPARGAPDGPVRQFVVWLLEARSSRGTAFPSSHVAVALTQAFLAIRYFGKRGVPLLGLAVCLALGAVYGGFHYGVDVLAGAVATAVSVPFALWSFRLLASGRATQAKASAPT